ncbi:MAG: S-layer glycoprotein N-glycosyltransferase AglJ [Methanomicrobiales archaeon]|nr:S-layer glycoprotein N-glycosyltransferase AglJ [Methanomicrobiales archaeon]
MDISPDEVTILIPTLNEAPTIGELVRQFRAMGFPRIMVMDGHSTDGTAELAIREGAEVLVQTGRGKGNAIIEAFSKITSPYVLMIDGDGTYSPADAELMLTPLAKGADQVIGERFTRGRDAFSGLNLYGNRVLNYLFKVAHGAYLSDILSGYRAFKMAAIRQMQLFEGGFEIEAEIAVESVRNQHRIVVVPVSYMVRHGTLTKLRPFRDGMRIARTIYSLAKMNNPIFYFGLIGLVTALVGTGVGAYIVLEWLKGIEHIPLTILTMLLITLGFQIFIFGLMGDMMLSFHRELMHEIHNMRRPPLP